MSVARVERPPGWFADSFARDAELLGTVGRKAAAVAIMVALLALPLLAEEVWVSFVTVTAISVITVTGLQILMGSCGQVSVGQSAFMGIGAYGCAYAATQQGWSPIFAIPFAGIATTVVGLVFALPTTRIRGFYLALTTMAAQFVFVFTVPRLPERVLGGSLGLTVSSPTILGVELYSPGQMYFLVVPVTVLLVVAAAFVNSSQLGREMVAVRENELAASVTGVHVVRTKMTAFGIASFYAGTAGALLAYVNGLAHFEQFSLIASIWFLGFLVVGGISRTLGAVLGTVLLSLVQEGLNQAAPLIGSIPALGGQLGAEIVFPMVNVTFGLLIIFILLKQPRGIAHLYSLITARIAKWPFH